MASLVRTRLNSFPGAFETSSSVLLSLEASAVLKRPYDYPTHQPGQYEALTLDDVRAAAREIVHPESLVWIIVGDRRLIESQISAVNIARTEHWSADGRRVD